MLFPTASSLQRTMACSASAVFPQINSSNEGSQRGSAIHLYLSRIVVGKTPEEAIVGVPPEFVADCLAVDVKEIPVLSMVESEVAFAYNPFTATARRLVQKGDRDYSMVTDDEFAGTADVVGFAGKEGDLISYVADFKTGSAFTVKSAKDNWQLKFLAVCIRHTCPSFSKKGVEVAIIRTLDGVRIDHYKFDNEALNIFELELLILADTIKGKRTRMVEGDHCRYCPSFVFCPAKTALIKQVVLAPTMEVEDINRQLTNDEAALAYSRYKAIKQIVHRLDGAFRMFAETNPIKLPDGMVFGPVTKASEELNATMVFDVLDELYGEEVAKEATTFDTSKAAIDRAIGKIAPKGTKAAKVREVLEIVGNNGGVELKTKTEIREHKENDE